MRMYPLKTLKHRKDEALVAWIGHSMMLNAVPRNWRDIRRWSSEGLRRCQAVLDEPEPALSPLDYVALPKAR